MMNTNVILGQQADFDMPSRVRVTSVRALPMTGATFAVATGTKRDLVDATPVCGYSHSHITDVAVLEGAFPGTSAWSPPN